MKLLAQTFDSPYGPLSRREMRALLSEAQNHRCCYCGCHMVEPGNAREVSGIENNAATIEHLGHRPGKGRLHDWQTVVAACHRCNTERGSFSPLDYFSGREALVKKRRWQANVRRRAKQRAKRRLQQATARLLARGIDASGQDAQRLDAEHESPTASPLGDAPKSSLEINAQEGRA